MSGLGRLFSSRVEAAVETDVTDGDEVPTDHDGHAAEGDDERASEDPIHPEVAASDEDPGPFVGPVLTPGTTDPSVADLHRLIRRISTASLDDEGVYGEATELAVSALQAELGARVDGVVGPVTWRVLRRRARGSA